MYNQIFNHYGYKSQRMKLVEECAELINAIMKNDDDNFVEEMADVSILINQFINHFPNMKKQYENWIEYKLHRTIERIK